MCNFASPWFEGTLCACNAKSWKIDIARNCDNFCMVSFMCNVHLSLFYAYMIITRGLCHDMQENEKNCILIPNLKGKWLND